MYTHRFDPQGPSERAAWGAAIRLCLGEYARIGLTLDDAEELAGDTMANLQRWLQRLDFVVTTDEGGLSDCWCAFGSSGWSAHAGAVRLVARRVFISRLRAEGRQPESDSLVDPDGTTTEPTDPQTVRDAAKENRVPIVARMQRTYPRLNLRHRAALWTAYEDVFDDQFRTEEFVFGEHVLTASTHQIEDMVPDRTDRWADVTEPTSPRRPGMTVVALKNAIEALRDQTPVRTEEE